jgi:hypothetical protein
MNARAQTPELVKRLQEIEESNRRDREWRAGEPIDEIDGGHIAELAYRAASYWHSIALAAERGERLTVEVHCRQVAAVTREAFATVKTLGSETSKGPV